MNQDEPEGGLSNREGPDEDRLRRATPPTAGGREVRVGIFVLLGLVSTLVLLFLLTDPATFRGRYMLVTRVEDAGGVRRGDPVQMRGVNIGRVHDFRMEPPGVAITLEINGQWEVPGDSRARITGMGLLDGRTIEIVPGESEEVLPPGSLVPGESSEGLMDVADALGGDAAAVTASLRTLLDEPTVDHLRTSASDLDHLLDVLTAAAEEQRAELQALTRTLSASADRVDGALASEDLERALARADSTLVLLNEASGSLNRSGRALESILARMDAGEGTLGRLSTDDALYRNLNDAAAAILALAEDVRENPSRYIRLRIF